MWMSVIRIYVFMLVGVWIVLGIIVVSVWLGGLGLIVNKVRKFSYYICNYIRIFYFIE